MVDAILEEVCDDGNLVNGDGCSSMCLREACGNRTLDSGEFCDDGNSVSGDGCNSKCSSNEVCGNGKVDVDEAGGPLQEECDPTELFPSPAVNTAECDSDCTRSMCGDGHFNPVMNPATGKAEECDTGADSPTCDKDCTFVTCGDRHLNTPAGEKCDNGLDNDNFEPNACRTDCRKAHCGDRVVDTGEKCDDANGNNGDDCPESCQLSFCGDGFVHKTGSRGNEACDFAAERPDSTCENNETCNLNCNCDPPRPPPPPPPPDLTAR